MSDSEARLRLRGQRDRERRRRETPQQRKTRLERVRDYHRRRVATEGGEAREQRLACARERRRQTAAEQMGEARELQSAAQIRNKNKRDEMQREVRKLASFCQKEILLLSTSDFKPARQSDELEVILKVNSLIQDSPKKFEVADLSAAAQ